MTRLPLPAVLRITLLIGGQHAYDLLEEDRKYYSSIASVSKKIS